jgi:hypothetical protein
VITGGAAMRALTVALLVGAAFARATNAPAPLAATSGRNVQPAPAAHAKVEVKAAKVVSRVDLPVDVITGSSELPKVLYIVPWRAATGVPGIDGAPDLGDQQLFQSLDPDAHGRLLHYRQLLGETVAEEKK